MEFKIEKKKEKRKRKPHYKFTVEFMIGDADGDDESTIEEYDLEKLKPLILATACCCAAYPNGRGGYDEYNGLPFYDAFFLEDSPDLDDYEDHYDENDSDEEALKKVDAYLNKLNPFKQTLDHPSEGDSGISTSFDGYSLIFIDENGDKSNVQIIFSEEEEEEIEKAKNFFK